jgi:hypothetical protein
MVGPYWFRGLFSALRKLVSSRIVPSVLMKGLANEACRPLIPSREIKGETPADTVEERFLARLLDASPVLVPFVVIDDDSNRFFSATESSQLKIPVHSAASPGVEHKKSKVRLSNFNLMRKWSFWTDRISNVGTEPLSSCLL